MAGWGVSDGNVFIKNGSTSPIISIRASTGHMPLALAQWICSHIPGTHALLSSKGTKCDIMITTNKPLHVQILSIWTASIWPCDCSAGSKALLGLVIVKLKVYY